VAQWFEEKFGSPTEPQERGWPVIQSGGHTLIAAPTGSGKTLAAFLASLDGLFREGLAGTLANETRVVYVSPLKALSNDIHKIWRNHCPGFARRCARGEGRDIEVRAEVRTGDTPAAKRQASRQKAAAHSGNHAGVVYLLLTSQSGRKMLATARTLIVDEIHAVVGNRRGSHLALSMERLQALAKAPVQRIGLSATQKPIEEVARFWSHGCLDEGGNPRCAIVDTGHSRKMDVTIELPGSPLEAVMSNRSGRRFMAAGRFDRGASDDTGLCEHASAGRTGQRHLCERLGVDKVTSHHGSLSARLRLDAENR